MWCLLIYIWFDTIHGVQSGIIRGLGRQSAGSIFTLICYYPVGMTLALVFAFVFKWGIVGLWFGFSIACIILDIGFFFIIYLPDWYAIADKQIKDLADGKVSATGSVALARSFYSVSPGIDRAMLASLRLSTDKAPQTEQLARRDRESGKQKRDEEPLELPGFGNH